jgi:transcriptional repressor NrdR
MQEVYMQCPFCFNITTDVKDSRVSQDKETVRRRRSCESCKSKFTTYEKIQLRELIVIKKSGAKKIFDRDKIYTSIATALRKRNVEEQQINNITDDITRELKSSTATEIPTKKIGELIMQKLESIDQVAYIRFASVYRDFNTAKDFAKFIGKIK